MRRVALALVALAVAATLGGIALFAALSPPRLPVPEPRDWVFEDVTLVEPGHRPRRGRTLRVEDGRLAGPGGRARGAGLPAPAASAREPRTPAPAEAPDLAGLFVVPGLIDMHVHYPPRVALGNAELWSLLLLAHGVTTVRELGSPDGSIFAVREAIRAGRKPGPRVFTCGAILDGEPPSFPSNTGVHTPDEARAAVAQQVARGADCIKAYNMLAPDVLAAIREAARAAGLRVIGHAPHAVPLEEAGLVDLQHGTGAVLVDRATVGIQDFRYEDWESVDDARIASVAEISLAQGIAHTPTLLNAKLRRLLANPPGAADFVRTDTGMRHLPRFWPRVWSALWGPPFAAGDAAGASVHAHFRARQAALAAGLHARGVAIHAGTDALMPFVVPGSSLHGELAELVHAGIPPQDVWRIATREAGRWLELPGLGTLAPGAPADLLFLSADPTQDLSALTRIEAVLAAGRLYRRADLDAALARFDAHFHGALYDTLMGSIVGLLQDGFRPDREAGTLQ